MDHDQYYTRDEIARDCFKQVHGLSDAHTLWLEPSAGRGAFYDLLPSRRMGWDIDPRHPEIIEADFLKVDLFPYIDQDIITIGNPPFGKNASLAVRFFNHSAEVSRIIAFILPRTFRKESIANRLDLSFHLIHDETLPEFSFVADGEPYDVPCCFQIWEQRNYARPLVVRAKTHPDFDFVSRNQGEFAIQRVGANAGRIKDINPDIADASHYFIAPNRDGVRARMGEIDFSTVKHETAGNPSISKGELISLYEGICPSSV